MTEYGVSVTKRFAFLEEDASDPEDVLTKTVMEIKKEKEQPKKVAPVVAPQPPKPTEKPAESRSDRKPKEGGERQAPRDGANRPNDQQRRFTPRKEHPDRQRDDRDQRPPGRQYNNNKDRPPRVQGGDENAPPRERDGDDRGAARGPRRFDGNRRYERKDGEPNANEDVDHHRGQRGGYQRRGQFNRGGGQPYNRGGRRDGQDQEQNANTGDSQNKVENPNEEKPFENESSQLETNVNGEEKPLTEEVTEQGEEKANEEPAEPEPVVKTLEEWKAETKKAELPQFNLRKPGEGGDQKIYQKLTPIKQDAIGKEKDTDDEDHHSHKEKREKALNIEIQFSDANRSNRGGTERGGFDRDRDRPLYNNKRGGGPGGNSGGYRGPGNDAGYRGDRGDAGFRAGGGENASRGPPRPRGPPREGNNTERGGFRGGRGGYSGGYRGPPRDGPSGSSVRPPPGFSLENEQFPALGAS